jgi:parvulin-like peptidyl-prolyl isomerase
MRNFRQMKKLTLIILIFLTFSLNAQNKQDKKIISLIKNVSTTEQAEEFIRNNKDLSAETEFYSSDKDSSEIAKLFLSKNNNETIVYKNYVYKITKSESIVYFRSSYIYFDGSQLNQTQIDSVRNTVLNLYNTGVQFSELATKYTMDENPNGGDLGWLEFGKTVKEYEDAVVNAKTGEVFKLDIPKIKWHYLVKKTFDNRTVKTAWVLKIKSSA